MQVIVSPLLTELDAAQLLGWSVHALRLRRFRGQEPQYLKLGGKSVRYEAATLHEFIVKSRINVNREG